VAGLSDTAVGLIPAFQEDGSLKSQPSPAPSGSFSFSSCSLIFIFLKKLFLKINLG